MRRSGARQDSWPPPVSSCSLEDANAICLPPPPFMHCLPPPLFHTALSHTAPFHTGHHTTAASTSCRAALRVLSIAALPCRLGRAAAAPHAACGVSDVLVPGALAAEPRRLHAARACPSNEVAAVGEVEIWEVGMWEAEIWAGRGKAIVLWG
eukprot:53032-Chlamydomonas_euryale.AAC.1